MLSWCVCDVLGMGMLGMSESVFFLHVLIGKTVTATAGGTSLCGGFKIQLLIAILLFSD